MRLLYRRAALLNAISVFAILLSMHLYIPPYDTLLWTVGGIIGFTIYFVYMRRVYHPRHFDEESRCWDLEFGNAMGIFTALILKPVVLGIFAIVVVAIHPEHSTKVGWVVVACSMQVAYYGSGLLAHGK